jgi:hypothetical protein
MASIRREVSIEVPAERLWDALRDVGALHTRLVKGFVTDCKMDGHARIDLLRDAMAPAIGGMIDAGLAAMKKTVESK